MEAGIQSMVARAGRPQTQLERVPAQRGSDCLYRKYGFVEDGRRSKHYRRASGEFWDSIEMGLFLE
jgi:hypothetical protein